MAEPLPKLPEGVTRANLTEVHIMAVVPAEYAGADRDAFDCPGIANYNVWVEHDSATERGFYVRELDKDFHASAYGSRELALAAARDYAWQIAAKYQLEVEEY